MGSIETGSYKYEVYDTNSTVSAALAVVETGLAFIQTATIGFNTYANSITYSGEKRGFGTTSAAFINGKL